MNLLERRTTHFVLWRPASEDAPPALVIGTFDGAGVPGLAGERTIPLRASPAAGAGDVWEIAAAECGLESGRVYHYWYEVLDTNVYQPAASRQRLRCTDPIACAVDWRVLAPVPPGYGEDDRQPAALVRFVDGRLHPTDPGPALATFATVPDVRIDTLPPNAGLVIYELPTAWTCTGDTVNASHVGVGTFRDVLALVEPAAPSAHFGTVAALAPGRAHLLELGVNALELLPPADSFDDRSKWGYGTTNYFAPDFDLGRPRGQDAPSACADLLALVRACHREGIRFFVDVGMAFAKRAPQRAIDFADHFVQWNTEPRDPEQSDREGFGGDLWKYGWMRSASDPLAGQTAVISPARQFMKAQARHWMSFFHVDGFRLDSLNNVRSYDFIGEFRDEARRAWHERWKAETGAETGADETFLVVGEELGMPMSLLDRVDGLWNEHFRRRVRNALVGRSSPYGSSFESTVREMIDGRLLGFRDGTEVVNYLGSHDVTNTDPDGTDNDRLFNFLDRFGVEQKEERIKLGFACLLTAVGVPMIFAGDEFADQMDFDPRSDRRDDEKQCDPLNLDRLQDPWRQRVFAYVSRLVKLRTTSPALAVNDTEFLHADFEDGKRVVVWKRGGPGQAPVVVVANFSDFATDLSRPDAEYRVPGWPEAPAGRGWREVIQDRTVPPEWVGREPIFPWEAKVYTWS